jgi:DNA-directed RNA polymerase specialized sigma24 family protein
MADDSLRANARVLGTLSDFASESELEGLGEIAVGTIRIELGKAGLASDDQVEEVFQDSLLKMYCAGDKPKEDFRGYFIAVSRNEARRHMRQAIREERTQRLAKEWLDVLKASVPLPPEPPLPNERPVVLKALARLPRRHRLIITWMFIDELDPAEVRERLQVDSGKPLSDVAFRVAKHRALKAFAALRESLAREAGSSEPAEGNETLQRASSQ